MFKSVFTRYITVFMLSVIVSFTILISIISSLFRNYSLSAREELVSLTVYSTVDYIERMMADIGASALESCVTQKKFDIWALMSALVTYADDVVILIVDYDGLIFFCDDTAI